MSGIILGGISSSITFLVLARIIQGIGISIFPIVFGMIKNQLPNDKVAIGVGIFSSVFAAGSVIGLAVGSNIVENFGWRTTFLPIFFIVITLWLIIRRVILDSSDPKDTVPLQRTNTPIKLGKYDRNSEKLKKMNISKMVAIKGTITFSLTITSFLLVISYSQLSDNTRSIYVPYS